MRHREARSYIGAYLDGDLDRESRALLDAHLDGCAACRSAVDELRGTLELLRRLPEPDPPDDLAARVMAQLREGSAVRRSGLGLGGWLPRTALAAGAVAAAGLALFVVSERPTAPEAVAPPVAVLPAPEQVTPEILRGRFALDGSLIGASASPDASAPPIRLGAPRSEELPPLLAEALRNPRLLVHRLQRPDPGRPTLEELAREARRAGVSVRVVDTIRGTRAPGAENVAVRFESVAHEATGP